MQTSDPSRRLKPRGRVIKFSFVHAVITATCAVSVLFTARPARALTFKPTAAALAQKCAGWLGLTTDHQATRTVTHYLGEKTRSIGMSVQTLLDLYQTGNRGLCDAPFRVVFPPAFDGAPARSYGPMRVHRLSQFDKRRQAIMSVLRFESKSKERILRAGAKHARRLKRDRWRVLLTMRKNKRNNAQDYVHWPDLTDDFSRLRNQYFPNGIEVGLILVTYQDGREAWSPVLANESESAVKEIDINPGLLALHRSDSPFKIIEIYHTHPGSQILSEMDFNGVKQVFERYGACETHIFAIENVIDADPFVGHYGLAPGRSRKTRFADWFGRRFERVLSPTGSKPRP